MSVGLEEGFWKRLTRPQTARLLVILTIRQLSFRRRTFEQVALSKGAGFVPVPWAHKYHLDLCTIETQRHKGSRPFFIEGYEIKSCRADFTADKKWQSYVDRVDSFSFVAPPGVISVDELPLGIGLLEPYSTGSESEPIHLGYTRWAHLKPITNEARFDTMYGLAIANHRAAQGYRKSLDAEIQKIVASAAASMHFNRRGK